MSRKRKLLFASLAIITVFTVVYLLFRERPTEVSVFKVRRGDVEATVTATAAGTVKARATSKISSQYAGKIKRILKREGAKVKAEETLMELENDDANAQVSLAEANHKAAKAELSQLLLSRNVVISQTSAMLSQAKAKLVNAAATYERAVSLYAKGMVSKQEMDNAKASFEVAQADHETAKGNELQGKMKDEEIKMATAKVEQTASSLELAKVQLSRTYITTPYAGIITQLFVEEGELLGIGTPVLQMADESEMEIDAAIDEVDAGKLRLGQDVKLTFDAFKEKRFKGQITEISPLVTTTKEQNRTVDIKIGITVGQEGLKVGMSTDVEVITGIVKGVLYIPTNSIIEKSGGQFVYIAEKGVVRESKIRTGLSNWDTTEVIEGVKEGDGVITSLETKKLKDGTKVGIKKE